MAPPEKPTIIIREGTRSDNKGLVCLASLIPMKGKISIRVDRKPDFFRLLEARGPSFVMVAEFNNKIIGSYSVSAMKVYINSEPETAYYLGDFKVHPDFRKSAVAFELTKAAIRKLQSLNADILVSAVIVENNAVDSFLQGSPFWPPAEATGFFNVYHILPSSSKARNTKYHVKECAFDPSYLRLFNSFMKKFQLGPVYNENSFGKAIFLTASLNNELVAAICLTDIDDKKQDVLIGLPFYLRGIVTLLNIIHCISPVKNLPRINEDMRILYIKSFSCEPGHEKALSLLLSRAQNLAYEKGCYFLTIGIHEKNPWKRIFSRYPKFCLRSNLFVGSLKRKTDQLTSIMEGIPFFDFSVV